MQKLVRQEQCNACGSSNLQPFRQRVDGRWVLSCGQCGMGVVAVRPLDLSALYADEYYSIDAPGNGYSNYAFTSEHGTAWAAALIQSLAPSGRVLDVGCADGRLLCKLLASHDCYGIEVNQSMASKATGAGVHIISHDILEPTVPAQFREFFDIVSAIAVLEHVSDMRGAIEAIVAMLKPGGFCLFEVPLISESPNSDVWFQSSLEHVFYPTERGLHFLIEQTLGLQLTGSEQFIKGYGSTYIGVLERRGGTTGEEVERLISLRPQHLAGPSEKTARLLLDVVHAAQTAPEQVHLLRSLPPEEVNAHLLARLSDLWSRDAEALQALEKHFAESEKQLQVQVASVRRVEEELKQRIARCDSLEQQLREQTNEHHSLREKAQQETDRLRALEEELQRQIVQCQALEEALKWNVSQCRSLEQELHVNRQTYERQTARVLELTVERARFEQRLVALEPELETTRQRVSELSSTLYRHYREADQIRDSLRQQTEYSSRLEESIARTQEQVGSLKACVGLLEADIGAMRRTRAWRAAEFFMGLKRRVLGLFRSAGILFQPNLLFDNLRNLYLFSTANAEQRRMWWEHFNPSFYASHYADIARSGISPTLHYLLLGFREHRWPASGSDAIGYVKQYQDVAEHRINPLLHYVRFGLKEGRGWIHEKPPDKETNRPNENIFVAQVLPPAQSAIDNAWPPDRPLLSVVIPCFNYGDYVESALQSVEQQTTGDLEVIVVEGGSTDGRTPDIVKKLQERGFPNARFLYRAERHLVGDNRNFGIAMARGRYICCLDADDMLAPVYLEVATFLLENYGFDIAYPAVQCFGQSTLVWPVQNATFPDIADENSIPTVAVFRRSAWAHAGGFRDWGLGEAYVFEDWEFWVRLMGHGCRAKAIRKPLMLYRVHGQGLSAGSEKRYAWHSTQIRAANADLIASEAAARSEIPRPIVVSNRLQNLLRRTDSEDSKPGVLLALPYLLVGGAERMFFTLAKGIAKSGYQPLFTTSISVEPPLVANSEPFESEFRFVYDLARLFDDDHHRRDFLFYMLERRDVRTLLLAGSEFVYHLLPEIRIRFPRIRVVDQLFNDTGHVANNRRYSTLIDLTIVPSRALADVLINKYSEAPERVKVIPHGVESGTVGLPHGSPAAAGSGLPADFRGRFLVSFFGRFSPEKAPRHFVEIASQLARLSDQYRFCMTGDGPERAMVLAAIETHGLQRLVHAPGFVQDLKPLLEASDVVVLPSVLDGMPLIVLEAQALGKCVVASSIGSLPEMIEDKVTGFLCPPGVIQEFVRSVDRLRCSDEIRKAISENAAMSVKERFSADRMVRNYLEILLLGHPSRKAQEVSRARAGL